MDYEHKLNLFIWATMRLMAAKYAYYVLSKQWMDDAAYDNEERSWRQLGRELDLLQEDETSPCIDWDDAAPYAEEGTALAYYYLGLDKKLIMRYPFIIKQFLPKEQI